MIRPVILSRPPALVKGLAMLACLWLAQGSGPSARVLDMLPEPLPLSWVYSYLAFKILLKVPSVFFSFQANQPLLILHLYYTHPYTIFLIMPVYNLLHLFIYKFFPAVL